MIHTIKSQVVRLRVHPKRKKVSAKDRGDNARRYGYGAGVKPGHRIFTITQQLACQTMLCVVYQSRARVIEFVRGASGRKNILTNYARPKLGYCTT
jgi:hypothetical protein